MKNAKIFKTIAVILQAALGIALIITGIVFMGKATGSTGYALANKYGADFYTDIADTAAQIALNTNSTVNLLEVIIKAIGAAFIFAGITNIVLGIGKVSDVFSLSGKPENIVTAENELPPMDDELPPMDDVLPPTDEEIGNQNSEADVTEEPVEE